VLRKVLNGRGVLMDLEETPGQFESCVFNPVVREGMAS
jgi:hypothetical protein